MNSQIRFQTREGSLRQITDAKGLGGSPTKFQRFPTHPKCSANQNRPLEVEFCARIQLAIRDTFPVEGRQAVRGKVEGYGASLPNGGEAHPFGGELDSSAFFCIIRGVRAT